jgi:zinc/manganese transport system ATP-binding protein
MADYSEEIIDAHSLSVGFNGSEIWGGAEFTIKPGEFIGLLGSNGAGKTTLFKVILGLSEPLGGSLNVFGEKPHKGNERIGYVPQKRDIDMESKINTLEYVRLGLQGKKLGFAFPSTAKKERRLALESLEAVDGVSLAYRPLNELSGGELQRVYLAQALIGKPTLLLLDEPLANLDIKRENQLIRLIHSLAKSEHIAVLLIAHDINPLLPLVDRIIYIANGHVASGKPEQIVTNKKLSKLYGAPIEVLRDSKGRIAVLGIEEAVHHDD